jgi:glucose-6-phosphate isomerase
LTLPTLRYHFICSIDPNEFHNVVSKLNPETTLFIVASKSFDTKETLANMARAIAWINQPNHLDKHLIAVTANVKKAKQVGIRHIIPIWNWVGGRYSACSSINLITCIAIGFERFSDLLSGAHAMDQHFLHQPFSQNLPVLLALLGIWNINFLNIPSLLILVYSLPLQLLVPYLQQLDMESNGKSRDLENRRVDYATGPIVWGGPADQVQHSYLQLVCQGTHRVTADIISVEGPKEDLNHQLAQAHQDVLSQTIGEDQGSQQVSISKTPMNHVSLRACSPEAIGALMALYEHKIFTQSVIWHINAFDQPGVDHLKHLID